MSHIQPWSGCPAGWTAAIIIMAMFFAASAAAAGAHDGDYQVSRVNNGTVRPSPNNSSSCGPGTGFTIRVRDNVVHYDRVREEMIFVLRAQIQANEAFEGSAPANRRGDVMTVTGRFVGDTMELASEFSSCKWTYPICRGLSSAQ